jgi:hypothetical protein
MKEETFPCKIGFTQPILTYPEKMSSDLVSVVFYSTCRGNDSIFTSEGDRGLGQVGVGVIQLSGNRQCMKMNLTFA